MKIDTEPEPPAAPIETALPPPTTIAVDAGGHGGNVPATQIEICVITAQGINSQGNSWHKLASLNGTQNGYYYDNMNGTRYVRTPSGQAQLILPDGQVRILN